MLTFFAFNRIAILLQAAIEIESDLFWTSLTADGYRAFIYSKSREIKSLITTSELLPREEDNDGGDIIKAIRRAVTLLGVKEKKKKRKIVSEDEDDEDED